MIVTTVKDKPALTEQARTLARELGCPWVERRDQSFTALTRNHGQAVLIVVGEKHISARIGEQEFFFHPSMALLRLMNFLKGEPDRMAEAMALQPGMSVLDCTLGFASDALVASYLTGPRGRVTGLEASKVVATLVRQGMNCFRPKLHHGLEPHKAMVLEGLPAAMARIEVVCTEHLAYLQALPDHSFDIVYFDPMFRKPCTGSVSMSPLRTLAKPDSLTLPAVQEAYRVARHRIVLKEGRFSGEFTRLGFRVAPGGRYSQVAFGVIEIGG